MCFFFRARWHENRTIFNTPNPRLMNVSLLRDNKLLHGQERRGSRMSVRMPSRQPSMASLRAHSPNPSLGKQGLYCTIIAHLIFFSIYLLFGSKVYERIEPKWRYFCNQNVNRIVFHDHMLFLHHFVQLKMINYFKIKFACVSILHLIN